MRKIFHFNPIWMLILLINSSRMIIWHLLNQHVCRVLSHDVSWCNVCNENSKIGKSQSFSHHQGNVIDIRQLANYDRIIDTHVKQFEYDCKFSQWRTTHRHESERFAFRLVFVCVWMWVCECVEIRTIFACGRKRALRDTRTRSNQQSHPILWRSVTENSREYYVIHELSESQIIATSFFFGEFFRHHKNYIQFVLI